MFLWVPCRVWAPVTLPESKARTRTPRTRTRTNTQPHDTEVSAAAWGVRARVARESKHKIFEKTGAR